MINKNVLKLNLKVPLKAEILMPFDSLKLHVNNACICDKSYEVNSGVNCTQFHTIDFTLP